MEPNEYGRFCSSCNKTVKDFRTLDQKDLKKQLLSEESQKPCGNFYAYQISKPFGNWKDKVIALYQRFQSNQNRFGILRPIFLFFITSLLIITGCRSKQLAGAYAYDFDNSNSNKKPKKEMKKEDKELKVKPN